MDGTLPVLRIFVSSTSVDLRAHREKVRDAVLRLENLSRANHDDGPLESIGQRMVERSSTREVHNDVTGSAG
jgi:hypothetical protein